MNGNGWTIANEMDLKEFQSCLHSLKQLYGLLQDDLSKNSVSVMLDDESRLLLKDLLDSAAENVFNIYSKKSKNIMEFTGSEDDDSPSTSEESDGTYHDCISRGSESADDSLNKLEDARQLTKNTAQQNACRSYLSKQASDAIKHIDELSDRMSDIVLQPESASFVVVQKPLMLANRHPYEKFNMGKQQRYHARDSDQMNRKVRKLQPSLPRNARSRFHTQHESDASLSPTSSKCESQESSIPYETRQWTPTSSESAKYSLSGDGSEEFSVSCSDDAEVYSWVSSDEPCESSASGSYYSGDDESEGYSKPRFQHRRQPRDCSVRSTSTKRTRPRRVDASSKWKNLGKRIGRWNKLKSIIFPHHHHHLHDQNHTDGNADEFSSSENRRACGNKGPSSKHVAKRSTFLKPDDAIQRRVQKPVNAMWGLIKHAHRAKKSKLPFHGSQYGKTKTHSKMSWFKMLKSHKKKSKKLGLGFRKRK